MTRPLSIVALLLFAVSAGAQMASHAPTVALDPATANAPANPPIHATGKPVAKVNGAVLTDRDLLREMYAIFPYARQHSGGFPKSMEPEIRKGALDMIVFEELVYQEAQRRKLAVEAARMSRAEAQFRKQFSSEEKFQQFLQAEFGGSKQVFRDQVRRSILIQDLLNAEVEHKSAVSEADLKAFYDKNPAKFENPEAFGIQSISILPPANANPEVLADAKKRAEEALKLGKAAKSYREFGLLAEKMSDDDFHVNMGDHKIVERAKLPPEILKVAETMKPGDVSNMIVVGNNYTFFRLNAHVPAGKVKLEDVKKDLRTDLQKRKYDQLRSSLDKRLRKTAKVEVL
jgi:peptidyl-prolyl cis-trans isomerase C